MLEFPFQRVICVLALEGDYPINVQYFQAHLSLPLFLWSFESPFSHATKSSLSLSTYLSLYIYIPLFHSLGAVISECRQRQPNDVTLSAGLFFLQVVPLIWPTPTPDFESELESESESELESHSEFQRNPEPVAIQDGRNVASTTTRQIPTNKRDKSQTQCVWIVFQRLSTTCPLVCLPPVSSPTPRLCVAAPPAASLPPACIKRSTLH